MLHLLSFLNNGNHGRNTIILQKFKHIYGIKLSIKAENFDFKIRSFDEIEKIEDVFTIDLLDSTEEQMQ